MVLCNDSCCRLSLSHSIPFFATQESIQEVQNGSEHVIIGCDHIFSPREDVVKFVISNKLIMTHFITDHPIGPDIEQHIRIAEVNAAHSATVWVAILAPLMSQQCDLRRGP